MLWPWLDAAFSISACCAIPVVAYPSSSWPKSSSSVSSGLTAVVPSLMPVPWPRPSTSVEWLPASSCPPERRSAATGQCHNPHCLSERPSLGPPGQHKRQPVIGQDCVKKRDRESCESQADVGVQPIYLSVNPPNGSTCGEDAQHSARQAASPPEGGSYPCSQLLAWPDLALDSEVRSPDELPSTVPRHIRVIVLPVVRRKYPSVIHLHSQGIPAVDLAPWARRDRFIPQAGRI